MDARLLTQHMYRLSVHCTDFATAATADSARELDNVKLLYTSYIYGQQIPRASYDAGITKPHCTTPTRTRVQVNTQYDKSTYIELRAPERAAAQAAAAASLPVPKPPRTTAPAIPAVTARPAPTPLPKPCPRQWRKHAHCRQLHSSPFVVIASSCNATGQLIMGSNWCASLAGCAGFAQCGAAWVRITRLTCTLS